MLEVRQLSNSSTSLNPFNSIAQAPPTSMQSNLAASTVPVDFAPTTSSMSDSLPKTFNSAVSLDPSQAVALSSILSQNFPSITQTNGGPTTIATADPMMGKVTGASSGPQPKSTVVPSDRPTVTFISASPSRAGSATTITASNSRPTSASQSDDSSDVLTTVTSFRTIRTSTLKASSSSSLSTSSTSSTSSSTSSATTLDPSSTLSIPSAPAARATSDAADMPMDKHSLSTGAIAGITFASAASVAIIAFLFFLCLRKRKSKKPPSIYPEEAYLYDPPITPPPESMNPTQPWMYGNTAYFPTTQMGAGSPPYLSQSPPMRATTPEGYERVGLLGYPEGQQDTGMLAPWPSLRRGGSAAYRPLGTGRGYRLPPLHEDLQEAVDNDPRNPFRDQEHHAT